MWAKYCEVLDNLFVQSMCIPSGSPMTAAPDIMTSSTSSLQGSRKSSGLRSESHDVKASCICTEFTSCYSSSMLLCTHNGFWKHHILFLPKMHKSLYAMWGRMHRTWQNLWERMIFLNLSQSTIFHCDILGQGIKVTILWNPTHTWYLSRAHERGSCKFFWPV